MGQMAAARVGVRQFRAELARYIAADTPVAVTKHGQKVGYFIPTKAQVEADVAALKKAGQALDQLLQAKGVVDIETIVTDLKAARKRARSNCQKTRTKAA